MFTRKAAIGFILLAVIVFPVAYISWVAPVMDKPLATLSSQLPSDHPPTSVYRPALVQFATPLDMAIAVTWIIEGFTLLCYLALKRLEPYLLEWEEMERERVREEAE